ncbi:hypothetical protein [Carbonactinospora thermoautotrophica]|uniref:Uncharacterized protein n=1 Tax=Carbonactinospora thermoautotrophica TaxID=1469144 RepID=A0A132MVG5_9ACTN|nr:hypothetical protein [Carbonactinospora thermoautotrophica]KWX01895.1 hypothetical protein LI90_2928 [Carbonactinospora thermoautotrophica]
MGRHSGDVNLGKATPDGHRGSKETDVKIPKDKDQGQGKTWRGEGQKK